MVNDINLLDIKTERIRFLYQNAKTGLAVNLLLSSLVLYVLWEQVEQSLLLYWFLILTIFTCVRALGVYLFNKKTDYTVNIHAWYYAFIIKSTLSAFLWGMTIWWFSPYDNLVAPVSLIFAIGGLTAGAAATLGSVFTVYSMYTVTMMLPSVLWFYLQSSSAYSVMSTMLIIYIFAMMAAGYIYRKVLIKSIMVSNDLVEAKNSADVANQAKSKFLSSMSHEFKTPLNAILGFAQLLKMGDDTLDKEQHENVDFILMSGQHLLNLVNDILELSKIEANIINLTIEDVSINEIVNECISLVQESAQNQQISLNNTIKDEDATFIVLADRTKLMQAILNLITNAIKYNHEKGFVDLSCYKNNDKLRIEITNTGNGISQENQEKIFTPFERLGYENTEVEGTGIGLVVTKQIVEAMKGQLGFTSRETKSTTFWIEIPLASST